MFGKGSNTRCLQGTIADVYKLEQQIALPTPAEHNLLGYLGTLALSHEDLTRSWILGGVHARSSPFLSHSFSSLSFFTFLSFPVPPLLQKSNWQAQVLVFQSWQKIYSSPCLFFLRLSMKLLNLHLFPLTSSNTLVELIKLLVDSKHAHAFPLWQWVHWWLAYSHLNKAVVPWSARG